MRTSDEGREFIQREEGLRLKRYRDQAGLWTIGYGHLIKPGENYRQITKEKAEQLLKEDLRSAENGVNRRVDVALNQSQFDALVSFTFNLGTTKLGVSTLLKVLNQGKYEEVPRQLKRWIFAGGSPSRGLIKRRIREATLFSHGVYA